MKKLYFFLLLMVPMIAFGKITITKSGDLVKVTGITRVHSPLASATTDTIYLTNIRQVTVNGNTIAFYQGKVPILVFSFRELSNKAGKGTATAYVEYLITNEYI